MQIRPEGEGSFVQLLGVTIQIFFNPSDQSATLTVPACTCQPGLWHSCQSFSKVHGLFRVCCMHVSLLDFWKFIFCPGRGGSGAFSDLQTPLGPPRFRWVDSALSHDADHPPSYHTAVPPQIPTPVPWTPTPHRTT